MGQPRPFNHQATDILDTVEDSLPNEDIAGIFHYPANIVISMRDGSLYVTKSFVIGVNSILGRFIKQPD